MVAKRVRFGIGILSLGGLVGCGMEPIPESGVARGEVLYARCAPCHGADGSGNPDISAPAIAGMEADYVARQLENFATGVRGSHADDAEGIRMMPMARALVAYEAGERDPVGTLVNITAVADYVAAMAPTASEPYLATGDATNGADLYLTGQCATCHGATGEGGPVESGVPDGVEYDGNAPALAGLPDWYIYAQLGKFQSGIRGSDAEQDPAGATMADWARRLDAGPGDFDQDRKDLAAYLTNL